MATQRYHGWCFTINNYTDDDICLLHCPDLLVEASYIIFGYEIGESGTPHLQGYIHFRPAVQLKHVKNYLATAHLEPAKFIDKSIEYCKKDGYFTEIGEAPHQGKRYDLLRIKEDILHGLTIPECLPNINNYQQLKFAESLQKYIPPNFDRKPPYVVWLSGKTGIGKTRSAIDIAKSCYGANDIWISGKNLQWWQGYYGQECIIIDEFRGDYCEFHNILRYLDRYPVMVEIKGSSVALKASCIIITSAKKAKDAYFNRTNEEIGQLTRRINIEVDGVLNDDLKLHIIQSINDNKLYN